MHTWLCDNLSLSVILLGTTTLVLGYAWWRTRQRSYAYGAGASIALIGAACLAVYLIPLLFGESDVQQIERKIREMAAGAKARDLDRISRHLAENFLYGSSDKRAFIGKAGEALIRHDVEDVVVWDFEFGEVSRSKPACKVAFKAKPKGNWRGSEVYYRCVAEFVIEPDSQWRMRTFRIFLGDTNQEATIPGF
jgi:hypothetical protein